MQIRASLCGICFLAAAGNVQSAIWKLLISALTFSAVSTLFLGGEEPPRILQEKQYPCRLSMPLTGYRTTCQLAGGTKLMNNDLERKKKKKNTKLTI